VDYYKREGLPHQVINTKIHEGSSRRLLNPILLLGTFFKNINRVEVVFLNVSQGGTKWLAPLLFVLTKSFGKKFVFRPFGSWMQEQYESYGSFRKWLFQKTVLRAHIFFLQTRALMNYFAQFQANTQQLPTSRDLPEIQPQPNFQKRFVFLGHIKKSKGIELLEQTAQEIDESYTIHAYGPIQDEKYRTQLSIYQGLLAKERVHQTLNQYDVLVLPTWFSGEGYPGVIIEAYSLGMPVITTQWKSIPEIVEDQKTGLLISPKSLKELTTAIQAFNTDNYAQFSQAAKDYFLTHFKSERVLSKVVHQIEKL